MRSTLARELFTSTMTVLSCQESKIRSLLRQLIIVNGTNYLLSFLLCFLFYCAWGGGMASLANDTMGSFFTF
jgi:hypothetical protein